MTSSHDTPSGDTTPVYQRIANDLRALIKSGQYAPGVALPSERKLMERYNVARMTVREALAELRTEGLIRSEPGAGVFVRERPMLLRISGPQRFSRADPGRAGHLATRRRRHPGLPSRPLRHRHNRPGPRDHRYVAPRRSPPALLPLAGDLTVCPFVCHRRPDEVQTRPKRQHVPNSATRRLAPPHTRSSRIPKPRVGSSSLSRATSDL